MENIIYCFSGTGNSLAIARAIAEKLGNTEVVLIADAMSEENINLSYQRIGFVFPAYFSSLPPIIERFVKKLNFNNNQYVFAVVTAGAMHGDTVDSFGGLIAEQGTWLDAGFTLRLPGNYIAMYGAWPARLRRYMLKNATKKTEQIAITIKEKCTIRSSKENSKTPKKSLTDRMTNYEKFALDYRVTDKCTGCGLCVKICPMHNITMVDGKPQFGECCERCMACIQWCPVGAIEYKDKTEKRKRCHNPNIKASDLFTNTK